MFWFIAIPKTKQKPLPFRNSWRAGPRWTNLWFHRDTHTHIVQSLCGVLVLFTDWSFVICYSKQPRGTQVSWTLELPEYSRQEGKQSCPHLGAWGKGVPREYWRVPGPLDAQEANSLNSYSHYPQEKNVICVTDCLVFKYSTAKAQIVALMGIVFCLIAFCLNWHDSLALGYCWFADCNQKQWASDGSLNYILLWDSHTWCQNTLRHYVFSQMVIQFSALAPLRQSPVCSQMASPNLVSIFFVHCTRQHGHKQVSWLPDLTLASSHAPHN